MTLAQLRARLVARAEHASLVIPASLLQQLEAYYLLLAKWNATINLTGLDLESCADPVLDRLLIEPVQASRFIDPTARSVIDIGSGGGSPAIPLAAACGNLHLTMVESRSRKAVFLREAARELGLRATVVNARYEVLLKDAQFRKAFDLLTIRAVRTSRDVLADLSTLVSPGGHLFHFTSVGQLDTAVPLGLNLNNSYFLTTADSILLDLKREA